MQGTAQMSCRRIHLSRDHIAELDKEQLISKWYQQEAYLNQLETAHDQLAKQADNLQQDLQTNEIHYKKRLNNLCMKLTSRDRKVAQLAEKLTAITHPHHNTTDHQLEASLIDPAINLMFEKMKSEVEIANAKVEEMQNELSAWKFTPDSTTGKRLMAKCRLLHNENEELGKETSTGWVAQLNGNLALQKKFSEEMKKSQTDLDEFLLELEEEVEGMQNTIYFLQQQLREAKSQSIPSTNSIEPNKNTVIAKITTPISQTSTDISMTNIKTTNSSSNSIIQRHKHEQQGSEGPVVTMKEERSDCDVNTDETKVAPNTAVKTESEPVSSPNHT